MKQITGGATAAKGFQAACTAAGIKYENRTDMAMIYSQVSCGRNIYDKSCKGSTGTLGSGYREKQ